MKFDTLSHFGVIFGFCGLFLANFDTLARALYIERLRRIIARAFLLRAAPAKVQLFQMICMYSYQKMLESLF